MTDAGANQLLDACNLEASIRFILMISEYTLFYFIVILKEEQKIFK